MSAVTLLLHLAHLKQSTWKNDCLQRRRALFQRAIAVWDMLHAPKCNHHPPIVHDRLAAAGTYAVLGEGFGGRYSVARSHLSARACSSTRRVTGASKTLNSDIGGG